MPTAKDDIIKEDIQKEAQKLFRQYGLKKTTMEDIARAMGKGKSTLYYYYCSKEEIFDAVVLMEMDEVFKGVQEAVDKACSAEAKLKAYATTRIRSVHKKINLYKMVNGELQDTIHCTKHLHTEYDIRETRLVKEIISFGIANGEFPPNICKEMKLLPSVMVSALRGLERDMLPERNDSQTEIKLASILHLIIRGLSNNENSKSGNT